MKEEKYWVLLAKKLSGEATAAELEELQDMLNTHPGWQSHLETLGEFWASEPVDNSAEQQKAEDAYLSHVNRLKEQASDFDNHYYPFPDKARKPFYKRWGLYATAALAIAVMVFVYPLFTHREVAKTPNVISISKGSRTKISLPDGSMVWINSGSKLSYEGTFSATSREVQLEGEAYFDVVKDPKHPFIVHTSGIDIKVLGTAFNVKAYTTDPTIEATLIHGAIEVTDKSQPGTPKIMLKPHEKLVFNKLLVQKSNAQLTEKGTVPETGVSPIIIQPLGKNKADSAITETAWVYNKLIFEEERFADLAVRMERWYNIKITIDNDKLKNFKISGSFVNETAEEAIKVLQMLVPFSYTINNNEINIMRK